LSKDTPSLFVFFPDRRFHPPTSFFPGGFFFPPPPFPVRWVALAVGHNFFLACFFPQILEGARFNRIPVDGYRSLSILPHGSHAQVSLTTDSEFGSCAFALCTLCLRFSALYFFFTVGLLFSCSLEPVPLSALAASAFCGQPQYSFEWHTTTIAICLLPQDSHGDSPPSAVHSRRCRLQC